MQALLRTSQAIGAQLGGLPATAKLLIGSLMVILVMSLLLVAQFAGRPSMVPLPIELDADGRTAALSYLERAGVTYEERDGRLLVPPDQKYTVLAQLAGDEVISGEQIRFESLIEQDSPFLTRAQNEKRWLIAKMSVLSALISKFRGIQRATVVIDIPGNQGFGSTHTSPTASVTVVPSGEGLSPSQVEAIADVVAGSQPGMKAADVRIVDARNGLSHQARNRQEKTAHEYLEVQRAAEEHVQASIENVLAYISGVRIAVNAMVDTRQVEKRTDTYEEPKIGPLESSRRTMESSSSSGGAEPGIQPNVGVALASAAGRGTSTTDERSSESTLPMFPRDASHIRDSKGYALKINATIGIPRSYFVAKYRQDRNDPEAVPVEAELDPIVTTEIARITSDLEPLIDTGAFKDAVPGTVKVSMIPDLGPMVSSFATQMPSIAAGGGGGGWGGAPISGDLIKLVGLLGLALLSLAMMFLMVRKAGIHADLPTAEEIVGVPPPLPTDLSEIVGEAEESAPALEGVEVDDKTLRRQQMRSQISEMVKQNPDEVANLLGRWIRVEA